MQPSPHPAPDAAPTRAAPTTPPRWLAGAAAITSLVALGIVVLMTVLAGAATPGYSHLSQFISELGARGAPTEWVVRLAGFLPAGVLLLAFCGLAYRALPLSRSTSLALGGLAVYAAGYLVAAAFPCDLGCRPPHPSPSQRIHNLVGMLGYLLAPASLFVLARAARAWPAARALTLAGYGAAALALLGLFTLNPAAPTVGLSQRLLEAAVLGWAALCGRYLAQRARDQR
jgi:hypothetical membrane protein